MELLGLWETAQVVEFLGVSRQAVSRRVLTRSLLGYPHKGTTRFPVWQFDREARKVHPEVAQLLAALGPDVDLADAAEWVHGRIAGSTRTPADLLLENEYKQTALTLAHFYRTERFEAPQVEAVAATPSDGTSESSQEGAFDWTRSALTDTNPTRMAILRAAAELFAETGPSKTTLRAVAKKADLPYSLIYRHFGTKENLLIRVVELYIRSGRAYLTSESDAYSAIHSSLKADPRTFGRMLMWAALSETSPDDLVPAGIPAGGYRQHIEELWSHAEPAPVRDRFDPRIVSAVIQLIGVTWDLFAPYLTAMGEGVMPDAETQRDQVVDMLLVLTYATRPST